MADGIQIGSTFAGYHVESVLGRGGMGVVFRAEQARLGRMVAIKVIAPELASDDTFRERFSRESRLAAAIEHPNAIPIYEAGVEGETPYLVMRYVDGIDLSTVIKRDGGLTPQRAVAIVNQVSGALDEAHHSGLVHRDVKPANVLVEDRRGREHAYLTDFGLTKATSSTSGVTATGRWVGTIDYASPEQIRGQRVDARADVYSLGCVLFAALTGRIPFERDADVAKLYAHINDPPPLPSSLTPGLPPALDWVVNRALAKDPGSRFQSAGDLGRAATAALSGESVTKAERSVAIGPAAPVDSIDKDDVAAPTPPAATVQPTDAAIPPTVDTPVPQEVPPTEDSLGPSEEATQIAAPTHSGEGPPPASGEGGGGASGGGKAAGGGDLGKPSTLTPGLSTLEDATPVGGTTGKKKRLSRGSMLAFLAFIAVAAIAAYVLVGGTDDKGSEHASTSNNGGTNTSKTAGNDFGIKFEKFTKAANFDIDLPKDSVPAGGGIDQDQGDVIVSEFKGGGSYMRVIQQKNRDGLKARIADAQASNQGEGSYKEISDGPLKVGSRDAVEYVYQVNRPEEGMGLTVDYTYAFDVNEIGWRVRASWPEPDKNSAEKARAIAQRMVTSLTPK